MTSCGAAGRRSHVVHGEGMAILAGDGLQADAFRLLAREPQGYHPTLMMRKLRVVNLIADAAGAPRHGRRTGDRSRCGRARARVASATPLTPEGLREMHARKTGALIRASVAAGAVMGGADRRALRSARRVRHRDRTRLSDRRRHPRRRRQRGDARQDGRARIVPPASRPIRRFSASTSRARWPPSVIRRRARPSTRPACSTRDSRTSRAGSLSARPERR